MDKQDVTAGALSFAADATEQAADMLPHPVTCRNGGTGPAAAAGPRGDQPFRPRRS